jgi:NIMA (never in mitosis gene a)-related kinase
MVTLKHAFDANSMKALVIKILRGNYPPIPNCYSNELKALLDDMLQKDPHRRPSIKKLIEKEFLSNRISSLLSQTVAKHEFGRTFETSEQAND